MYGLVAKVESQMKVQKDLYVRFVTNQMTFDRIKLDKLTNN